MLNFLIFKNVCDFFLIFCHYKLGTIIDNNTPIDYILTNWH